ALFGKALQETGWIAGKNLEVVVRSINPNENVESQARDIVSLGPDVILAHTTRVLVPLSKQTKSIPIVFISVSDPLAQGIVTSLARPTENVTGFSNPPLSVVGKSLQMIKQVAPEVKRLAVVISTGNGAKTSYFAAADGVATSLDLTI